MTRQLIEWNDRWAYHLIQLKQTKRQGKDAGLVKIDDQVHSWFGENGQRDRQIHGRQQGRVATAWMGVMADILINGASKVDWPAVENHQDERREKAPKERLQQQRQ